MAKLPKVSKVAKVLPKKPLPRYNFNAQTSAPPPPPTQTPSTPSRPAGEAFRDSPRSARYVPPRPNVDYALPERSHILEAVKARQASKVNRWRQLPLMVMGLAAFGMGIYTVSLWISLTRDAPAPEDLPADLQDRFDKEAEGYDEKVGTAEMLLRLTTRRKAMMEQAHGHVLEVAVGTGRNTPYYPTKKCETVTLLDYSAPMLAVAKRKWKDAHPEYFSRVFFKQQSALEPITPPYGAQDGYDTVVQTMGLCSTPEPVRLLQNLEATTKENGGKILLLEHGKSHYDWLNNILDKTAPAHADEHGCWWNKDIGKIVEESGLEVVDIKRYNFGTTWWVELKPRRGIRAKALAAAKQAMEGVPQVAPASEPAVVSQKPWWSLWR
jgi:methyltransferase OMS1